MLAATAHGLRGLALLSPGPLASSAGCLAPALLCAARQYGTLGRRLLFGENGVPEKVLRLNDEPLPAPSELGEHEVLIHVLAVGAGGALVGL